MLQDITKEDVLKMTDSEIIATAGMIQNKQQTEQAKKYILDFIDLRDTGVEKPTIKLVR